MAAESDGTPSLRIMREAARRYIAANGLRELGRQIEMSASGADKVVKGRSRPHEPTLRKFRRWYLRACDAGDLGGATEGPALIGIRVLVQELPRPRQRAAALRLYDVAREEMAAAGQAVPRWVSRLERLIKTEWP